jgi:hypothetical protein
VTTRIIPRRRGDPSHVTEIDRESFLQQYFRYRPGEHVTVLAPTDCGKTYLTFQLLERAHEQTGIPPIFFATKPRDDFVRDEAKRQGYRTIDNWPPPVTKQLTEPGGWLLWPKHTMDAEVDDYHHGEVFRRAMMLPFKAGAAKRNPRSSIEVWDEAGTLAKDLGLHREQRQILKRGRSCKCGAWTQDQRAAWLPMESYNCAEHLFLHRDPVKDNRDRYDDIGGFDSGLVSDILKELPKWHYLYLRQSDQRMCVVGP